MSEKWLRSVVRVAIVATMATAAWGAGVAAASAQEPLRVATPKVVGASALYIARARGYFDAEGIGVEELSISNFSAVVAGVLSGDVDIALTGLSAGFWNTAGTNNMVVIAGLSSERAGFRNATIIANNEVADGSAVKDLLGESWVIGGQGSNHHYFLLKMAEKNGLSVDEVKILQVPDQGSVIAAVSAGSAAAGIASGSVAASAAAEKSIKILGYVGDEVLAPSQVVVTRRDLLETRRDDLVKFLRAYLHGASDYDRAFQTVVDGKPTQSGDAQAVLAIISEAIGQTTEVVQSSLIYLEPKGGFDVDLAASQISLWQEFGLVDKSVTVDNALDTSLLTEATE